MGIWRGWVMAGCLVLGSGAAAQSPADAVVQQLREQGYLSFKVSRTLLGRTRVIALTSDGGRREIVFSPASGEILRDYYEAADGTAAPKVLDRPDDGGLPSTTGKRNNDDGLSRQDDGSSPHGAGQSASPSPRQSRDDSDNLSPRSDRGKSGGAGEDRRGAADDSPRERRATGAGTAAAR